MGITPQDREAAKREDGRKHLVLSGTADRRSFREEYLTDTEFRRGLRARRERRQGEE